MIVLEISGTDLSGLENESGGHRIQRIPPTERKGRVHTSTVTVAILDSISFSLKKERPDSEFKIEWFSGTGAGGQHRNKHQNSARITHLKTGLVETSQQRSRAASQKEALEKLNYRLDEMERNSLHFDISKERKEKVGSGMRGDKIRTYRFQDDSVTDHISGKKSNLSKVLSGNFELLWN